MISRERRREPCTSVFRNMPSLSVVAQVFGVLLWALVQSEKQTRVVRKIDMCVVGVGWGSPYL